MKNLCKPLLFFALLIPLISCKQDPEKATREVTEEVFEAPKQIISLSEADSLYVNYQNRRASIIEKTEMASQPDGKPFSPTQFISFDIKVLKEYIGYVEQEAKKGGTTADSLRVYLGNYGATSRKYPNKNTVFLIPTAEVNGNYGAIFIDSEGKAKLVRDWISAQQGANSIDGRQKAEAALIPTFSASPIMQDETSLTLNRGNGGPPPKTDF
ncbi:hypothetical protein NYZ99_04590 [Maribacter litopenaei]|uniref:DUF4136 domain-containing protein n=1 Tax=Maribacter litopenaei TaxID=2976127 RepID=A0ABY5YA55_9FLAO|nr:hypothetical protein [Maribacter litopenaei]UWX55716.1 hypothetical protein NYZ99_04590 [Maribacter litopenaei]